MHFKTDFEAKTVNGSGILMFSTTEAQILKSHQVLYNAQFSM